MEQKKAPPTFSLLPKVINGSVAGIVGVTCVFPIDLVKTRLQNQRNGIGRVVYKNMLDCGIKTFRREGLLGMYKGSGVNLLLITPEKVIKLVGNDFFRHQLINKQTGKLTLPREMLAGAGAGCLQTVVTTPMELLKIHMQNAGQATSVRGAPDMLSTTMAPGMMPQRAYSSRVKLSATRLALHLVKQSGLASLYRGGSATVLRDVSFSVIYFPLFAHLNSLGKRKKGSDEAVFYVSFLSGCTAGAVASFSVTPTDVIKTRLQMVGSSTGGDYSGVRDCFVKVYSQEGAKALFKGGLCRMMVVAPLFGVAQVVYYMGIGEKTVSAVMSKLGPVY